MNAAASLKGLYQAMDFERPLDVENIADKALYVPGLHTSNGINPVDELSVGIEMSDKPNTWLFTGHRGVGKSTELRRLAADLRDKNYLVFVADVGEYLNLSEPVSTSSLLLTIVAALSDGLEKFLGKTDGEPGYVSRFWNFLKTTEIDVSEVDIADPGDIVSAKLVLKQHPDLLQQANIARAGSIAQLSGQVSKFAEQVVTDAQEARNGAQVVLILDSLERLRVVGADAKACYDAISRTFDTNAEFLKVDHVHVVYSVPPYLPFLIPRIGSYFGVEVCSLPHVKVFETPINDSSAIHPALPCASGQRLMIDSVQKRYPSVMQLIPLEMLEKLALASSGSMRDFFRLIRSVCSKGQVAGASLPLVDSKWVDLAQQVLRNEMPLSDDDKKWLERVRRTHGASLNSINNLHELARLFDSGVILNYRNGRDWCDVHYLLHDQLVQ